MTKAFVFEKDSFTSDILAQTLDSLGFVTYVYQSNLDLTGQLMEADAKVVFVNLHLFKIYRHYFVSMIKASQKLYNHCIVLTSGELEDPDEIRELGADYFLLKPYGLRTLSDLLVRAKLSNCYS